MKYRKIVAGKFIKRPNRFIAFVEVNGKIETVHVKNTGRCKELLPEGAEVFLEESDNPLRKTKYDLVAVTKNVLNGKLLINMDSQAPNKAAGEWILSNRTLFPKIIDFKPEFTFGDSRFDFYVEFEDDKGKLHKKFIEVKGVTLEENGVVRFPDAPTLRGLKHVTELSEIALKGDYECAVLFVIQMEKCSYFEPNNITHKDFGDALKNAKESGVQIMAYNCRVTRESMDIGESVEVRL